MKEHWLIALALCFCREIHAESFNGDGIEVESTTPINSYLKNYQDAISEAFVPRECVFTNAGYDYRGVMKHTADGHPCRSWSIGQDLWTLIRKSPGFGHRLSMVDGHVGSQGFCRIPFNSRLPPSCFRFLSEKVETCSRKTLPFCPQFRGKDCRHTGNGQEYMGSVSRSRSGRQCLPWKKTYHQIKTMLGDEIKGMPFNSTMNRLHEHFPELRDHMYEENFPKSSWWRHIEHNHCRNWYPWSHNGRDQGPYCFVEINVDDDGVKRKMIAPETCDIPFCDAKSSVSSYITRGSNSFMETYLKMPANGSLLLDIRSWTVEYPIHVAVKFADSAMPQQKGYLMRVGPLDTIISKIKPIVKIGSFRKWKQFSPNRTMAVEWRRMYFDFNPKHRTIEIGDILNDGKKEMILSYRDREFVEPKVFSAVSTIEGATFCPRIPIDSTVEFRNLLEGFATYNIFYDIGDYFKPRKDFYAFEKPEMPSVIPIFPGLYYGYQHPYKDCQLNYQRSRLMVNIPHLEGQCEEFVATHIPTFLHPLRRTAASPDNNPVYEMKFTLRSYKMNAVIYLLDQPGAFPRWFQDFRFEADRDFYMRWNGPNPARFKDKDRNKYIRVADYVVPNAGYLIAFNSTERDKTKVFVSYAETSFSCALTDGSEYPLPKLKNSTIFLGIQEDLNMFFGHAALKETYVETKYCPSFFKSKTYMVRGNRKKFQLFHIDKNNKHHELISWSYELPSTIQKTEMGNEKSKHKLHFAHKLLKNADPMISYISFGIRIHTFFGGRQLFYTVDCVPKSREKLHQYPNCALTRDDPMFAGQWGYTNTGLPCARWDDPFVKKYDENAFRRLMKGWHIEDEYYRIDEKSFKRYKEVMNDYYTYTPDLLGPFRRLSYKQFKYAQELAGNYKNFPGNSITASENSCRILGSNELGPFCFAYPLLLGLKHPFLYPVPMPCELPLCNFDKCSATITGHEFRQQREVIATDALFRACEPWNKQAINNIFSRFNTKNGQKRLRSEKDRHDGRTACINFIFDPSTDDVGVPECFVNRIDRLRVPCQIPICEMGACAILIAFDPEQDKQNFMRILGEDPKYFVFGLRHMSTSPDDMDGRLVIEYTDQPSQHGSRESLIIELGFKVEIKYKGVKSSTHSSLIYEFMPSLIRVIGVQRVWIAFDHDEVHFGKNTDFRNPLISVQLEREPREANSVFRFISMQSTDMMSMEYDCALRCPIWYLVSPSRLYEHYLQPEKIGTDIGWKFRLTLYVRWTDDFQNEEDCGGHREKGGVRVTFSETAYNMSLGSQVIVSIHQGTRVSLALKYAHGHGHISNDPITGEGESNDCGDSCWTEYTLTYRADRTKGRVVWKLLSADDSVLAILNVKKYNDRGRAFLPMWFHAAALSSCQIPANVAFNCSPAQDFSIERVDGSWSDWSPLECNAPCDSGFGSRERTCNNPSPNFWGQFCEGEPFNLEVCNDFKCGTFNPDIEEQLATQLRSKDSLLSLSRKARSQLRLSCQSPATTNALQAVEGTKLVWYFNRDYLEFDRWKQLPGGDIYSKDLSINDTGVYVCNAVTPEPEKHELTAVVIALSVYSDYVTINVHEGEFMEFPCNIEMLGIVYADLSQIWLKDGKVYQDLGVTLPASTNLFSVRATSNLSGVWQCQVKSEDLGLTWMTAWQRVLVLKKRTWLNDFYQSIIYRKMTEMHGKRLWISLGVLIFIILVSGRICLLLARRKMRKEAATVKEYLQSGDIDEQILKSAGVSLAKILDEKEEDKHAGDQMKPLEGDQKLAPNERKMDSATPLNAGAEDVRGTKGNVEGIQSNADLEDKKIPPGPDLDTAAMSKLNDNGKTVGRDNTHTEKNNEDIASDKLGATGNLEQWEEYDDFEDGDDIEYFEPIDGDLEGMYFEDDFEGLGDGKKSANQLGAEKTNGGSNEKGRIGHELGDAEVDKGTTSSLKSFESSTSAWKTEDTLG